MEFADPELSLSEIVMGGITTVLGCLGTDTTTKTTCEAVHGTVPEIPSSTPTSPNCEANES
jgi:hypothetical protein